MPDIGVPELLIILVIVLVLFGGDRLTDIMKAMGKGVAEFRKGMSDDVPPDKSADKKEKPL